MNFLKIMLSSPSGNQDLIIGVRITKSQKLAGVIAGIPTKVNAREHIIDTIEAKYLCIIPQLYKKGLSTVLIKELTRRAELKGLKQGIFVSEDLIGRPISYATHWFRPLNLKKLMTAGFL
jgi:glycylpeptide N-tetradecanoyltransferase